MKTVLIFRDRVVYNSILKYMVKVKTRIVSQ